MKVTPQTTRLKWQHYVKIYFISCVVHSPQRNQLIICVRSWWPSLWCMCWHSYNEKTRNMLIVGDCRARVWSYQNVKPHLAKTSVNLIGKWCLMFVLSSWEFNFANCSFNLAMAKPFDSTTHQSSLHPSTACHVWLYRIAFIKRYI